MRFIDYLPVEIIFNILCLYRRKRSNNAQSFRTALQRRGLHSLVAEVSEVQRPIPRLPFWIRLCQAASLLDEDPDPYPTLLANEWIGWPFYEQIFCLVDAWKQVPRTKKTQRVRVDLLQRLIQNVTLGAAHRQEIVGLQALGICEGEQLSQIGLALLGGSNRKQIAVNPPGLWSIAGNQLVVSFPPDWGLLWELEKFLDPIVPGVGDNVIHGDGSIHYSLDAPTIRLAVQRGALSSSPTLLTILESGLGEKPPFELLQLLTKVPTIRLIPGFVLEFSHPEELKRLRQSPGMRRELGHLLSPRHVALDIWHGPRVMQQLYRLGLLSENDLSLLHSPGCSTTQSTNSLTKSQRVYLLSLMLLVDGLQNAIAPPPGLLTKLTEGVSHSMRAAAARKATSALNQIKPETSWQLEESPPAMPSEELIESLQGAINTGEAIDILYQASGRHTPEYRHLTPLLIESRSERFYLIAYCHTRRANRTFRLDRLKLCE